MHNKESHSKIEAPVIVIIGPTAIGKTDLSISVAREYDCEVVSVDSMQVYRYMDIGTAKIKEEEKQGIPHHLIDIVNPDDEYNVARFVEDALECIGQIHRRNRVPLLTGGTGLYLNSLKNGIFEGVPSNPEIREKLRVRIEKEGSTVLHGELAKIDGKTAENIHPNDTTRIIRALEVYQGSGKTLSEHFQEQQRSSASVVFKNMLTVGLKCSRDLLYDRINKRTRTIIEGGLENEVNTLLEMGYSQGLKSMQSIGYRHMCNYIKGAWTENELFELLARDTRRYAKRQYTWFRKDRSIHWFERDDKPKIQRFVSRWYNSINHGVI